MLEINKTYIHKISKRKIVILGRLDTICTKNCLIAEDCTYGILMPITNEESEVWEEVSDDSPHPFAKKGDE